MGWLTRKPGLSFDNLVSAEVVAADGAILRVATERAPGPVLGDPRRRRQLRCRHRVRVPRCTRSARWCSSGCSSGGSSDGPQALRADPRRHRRRCPRTLSALIVGGLHRPAAAVRPRQHHFAPGSRADRRRLRLRRGARRASWHRIREQLPAAVRDRHPDALRRAAADARRGATPWGSTATRRPPTSTTSPTRRSTCSPSTSPRKSSPLSFVLIFRLDGAYSEVGRGRHGVRRRRDAALLVVHHRACARTPTAGGRPRLGPLAVGRAAPAHDRRRQLRQLHGRGRRGPGAGLLRAGKYERLARDQGPVRPGNVFHRNANIKPA